MLACDLYNGEMVFRHTTDTHYQVVSLPLPDAEMAHTLWTDWNNTKSLFKSGGSAILKIGKRKFLRVIVQP